MYHCGASYWKATNRMAQGLDQNRKPEQSEPIFPGPGTQRGTGITGTVFLEPKEEPEPCLSAKTLLKCQETLSPEEPSEPRTGTIPSHPEQISIDSENKST